MKVIKFIIVFLIIFGSQVYIYAEDKVKKPVKKIQPETTPEFKDILDLTVPSSIRISPDGKYILYSIRKPDWEKNSFVTQIWMADVKTGKLKQMTFHKKGSYSYVWSPDSRKFAFKSNRGDKTQLFIMSVSGGEGRQIGKFKNSFSMIKWSPNGKQIAYRAKDKKSKHDKSIEKKYGGFKIIDKDSKPSALWLLNIKNAKTEKLFDNKDLNVSNFNWSPDGKQIVFSATPDSRIKSFSKSDIYVFKISKKKLVKLVDKKGPDSSPIWSHDGKYIAFNTSMGTESYFVNREIAIIPANGGDITCLTKDFDENANIMHWKKEGIYFSALNGMSSHLYLLKPKNSKVKKIDRGNWMFQGSSISADGKYMAFSYKDKDTYPELYFTRLKSFKPIKLTDFSSQLKKWTLSTKESISWKSKDGAVITGVLIKPADFDPKKKYPLFVIIHGGPTGISYPQKLDRYNAYYPIEQWAAKGAVFLEPNYRGSAGFGSGFRKLNYRNLGVGDYWDVISGVDHLISKGFVDQKRVASMGWSQGGYISAFITTYSNRFKAVSVGAGISDWISYYYRTDITPFTIHYLGANPWEDPEVYKKTSPMTHINNAKTPTLIQHGEFDQRVPTNNAYKLYRGLQDKGVPSKLIIYKGFGHGIRKPKELLAVQTHNWRWFNKYIFGEEPEVEKFDEEKKKEKPEKKK